MPRLCRSSQNRVASFNPSLPDGDIHLSDAPQTVRLRRRGITA